MRNSRRNIHKRTSYSQTFEKGEYAVKELGDLLKKARQDNQISLSEISERTKIQVHYLEALENGDFDRFSGEVYLKGGLKNYAEAVGLDPEEVLDLYRNLKGDPAPEEPLIVPREKPPAPPQSPRGEKGPSFIYGLIVLILLLAAGGYWFTSQYMPRAPFKPGPSGNQAEPAEPEDPAVPGEEEPGHDEAPPPLTAAKIKVSAGESTPLETVFSVGNVEQLELKLLCNEHCWIKMVADGQEQFQERTLPQGEEIVVDAAEKIWIRLGNPPGVKLTVNGIEVTEISRQKNAHNFLFVRK